MLANHFLDSLPPISRERVEPHLKRVTLARGQLLIEAEAPVNTVHFPITAQLANVAWLGSGDEIETAVIGAEGLSGLAPGMADRECQWSVRVRAGGEAWALPSSRLRQLSDEDALLRARLVILTGFYQAQASQNAACNVRHDARSRLARWLLTASDLSPGIDLRFTQEDLAHLLGYARTTVVEMARPLKVAKVLRYERGVIRIMNRSALEAAACECYGRLRAAAEHDGLLPPRAPGEG